MRDDWSLAFRAPAFLKTRDGWDGMTEQPWVGKRLRKSMGGVLLMKFSVKMGRQAAEKGKKSRKLAFLIHSFSELSKDMYSIWASFTILYCLLAMKRCVLD